MRLINWLKKPFQFRKEDTVTISRERYLALLETAITSRQLVAKIIEIGKHPEYQNILRYAAENGMAYDGPDLTDETVDVIESLIKVDDTISKP